MIDTKIIFYFVSINNLSLTLFSIYSRFLRDLFFLNNSICFFATSFNLTNLSDCGIPISINSAFIFSKLLNLHTLLN